MNQYPVPFTSWLIKTVQDRLTLAGVIYLIFIALF